MTPAEAENLASTHEMSQRTRMYDALAALKAMGDECRELVLKCLKDGDSERIERHLQKYKYALLANYLKRSVTPCIYTTTRAK